MRREPGAARRGGEPRRQDPPPTPTTSRRPPTRSTRSRSSTRSRCRSSSPASGRTSRPAGSAPSWSGTSPVRRRSGSPSPTVPISTRSIQPHSTAGTTSSSSSWRTARRQPARPPSTRQRRSSTSPPWGSRPATRCSSRPTRSSRVPSVRRRAGRLPPVAVGPRPLRQRRRRWVDGTTFEPRRPVPGVRGVLLHVPGAVHDGEDVVSRRRRRLGGGSAVELGRRRVHVERPRGPAHGLRRDQHGLGRPVEQRVGLAVGLAAEPGGDVRLVRHAAAVERYHRDRWGRRRPLGAVVHAGRGPPSHRQRGATRRERDVRAERLAAGE